MRKYDKDIRSITHRFFKNIIKPHQHDDFTQDFYLYLTRRDALKNFDSTRGMKFSSYVFMLLKSYILAYRPRYTGDTSDASDHTADDSYDSLMDDYTNLSPIGKKMAVNLKKSLTCENEAQTSIVTQELRKILVRSFEKRITNGKDKELHTKSKNQALFVFDKLLEEYQLSEIAKAMNTSTQRVLQIKYKIEGICRPHL